MESARYWEVRISSGLTSSLLGSATSCVQYNRSPDGQANRVETPRSKAGRVGCPLAGFAKARRTVAAAFWMREQDASGTRDAVACCGGMIDTMAITIYGVCVVTFMMVMYALEGRDRRFIVAFAVGCLLSSVYGFLSGAWPFGVVEAIWSGVALRRFRAAAHD